MIILQDADTVDFNLLISGPATVNGATGTAHAIDLIDLVEKRKDSVVFLSPYSQAVVPGASGSSAANSYQQINNVTAYFDSLPSSSYAVFDSGYKKIYDKYNDTSVGYHSTLISLVLVQEQMPLKIHGGVLVA